MPLTQTQLASAVADRAELSKTDAKRALAALEEVVLEQLGNAEKVRIGGMVQLTVRVKPAQKKRQGRNPATGEARERPLERRGTLRAVGARCCFTSAASPKWSSSASTKSLLTRPFRAFVCSTSAEVRSLAPSKCALQTSNHLARTAKTPATTLN